jgi:hypothetical protein
MKKLKQIIGITREENLVYFINNGGIALLQSMINVEKNCGLQIEAV